MSSWHSYAKLYALGHGAVRDIFKGPIIIEEKVDGSQLSFGLIDGALRLKSKSKDQSENTDKMFLEAKALLESLAPQLTPGWTYRGEYLQKPKHNTLAYDRIPAQHIMIFDINTGHEQYLSYEEKKAEAERLGLECVPLLMAGEFDPADINLDALLDRVSVLGGQKIEGFVIKNHQRFCVDGKAMMAKFVSEAFKEVHRGDWKERNGSQKDIVEQLALNYTTPARWQKAVQHLAEAGTLTGTPKDIGALIKEVQADVLEECGDEIRERLMAWAWPNLERQIVKGLAQWYKRKLASEALEGAGK